MNIEDKVVSRIDGMQQELVDFTLSAMKIKTISPGAEYSEIAEFLGNAYKGIGLEVKLLSGSEEKVSGLGYRYPRPNVLGLLKGIVGRPMLEIFAHLDTVQAGDLSLWKTDPFEPVVRDGKIVGLGAIDARGSLAAAFYAAKAIIESGVRLNGSLLLVGTVDDEVDGDKQDWPGTPYLVEEGHRVSTWGLPDWVINGESSGLDEIWGAFKGRFTFEVEIEGRRAHAGTSHGVNAIEKALKFIDLVKAYPINHHRIMGPDGIYLYTIRAGEDRRIDIPDSCHVGFDIRYIPRAPEEGIKRYIQNQIEELRQSDPLFHLKNMKVRRDWDAFEVDPENPLIKAIEKAASKVGVQAKYGGLVGAGQTYPYLKTGIPCVTYGAGKIDRAHSANEYVGIDELLNQAKIYALAALKLCG